VIRASGGLSIRRLRLSDGTLREDGGSISAPLRPRSPRRSTAVALNQLGGVNVACSPIRVSDDCAATRAKALPRRKSRMNDVS